MIASYCCPALKTKQYYIDRLKIQRIPDVVEDKEYIEITDYLRATTLFVKSGMGTGKTHGIKKLPKDVGMTPFYSI